MVARTETVMREVTSISQHLHCAETAHFVVVSFGETVVLKAFDKLNDYSLYVSIEQAEKIQEDLREALTKYYNAKAELGGGNE